MLQLQNLLRQHVLQFEAERDPEARGAQVRARRDRCVDEVPVRVQLADEAERGRVRGDRVSRFLSGGTIGICPSTSGSEAGDGWVVSLHDVVCLRFLNLVIVFTKKYIYFHVIMITYI